MHGKLKQYFTVCLSKRQRQIESNGPSLLAMLHHSIKTNISLIYFFCVPFEVTWQKKVSEFYLHFFSICYHKELSLIILISLDLVDNFCRCELKKNKIINFYRNKTVIYSKT